MPFDSLAKAFSEEFRLPPDTFPATEAAALQGDLIFPRFAQTVTLACYSEGGERA